MSKTIKVAELFAGVGGFRLGLDGYRNEIHPELNMPGAGGFKTVWANQWEPPGTFAKQFAFRCYERRFGPHTCLNMDIAEALDLYEAGECEIPDVDMVVGGFPCQDYSVARPLSHADGIEGRKGVLWWEIYRFLQLKSPRYCLFENVDRLLKSPATQRGRDFAIMLSCLSGLDYAVEWRVVNSADYGFPQRRKRVYIFAEKDAVWNEKSRLTRGIMASALPIEPIEEVRTLRIGPDPYKITKSWPNVKVSPFLEAGCCVNGRIATCRVVAAYEGERRVLGDVLVDPFDVPDGYLVPEEQLPRWEYLKGAKRERRVAKSGHEYWYCEGSMAFPDLLTNPSRTILTGEGGSGPSRFKHIIIQDGRWRRLVPDELDQLQGFPAGWTNVGITDNQRAFCMGNALVVGVVQKIGSEIAKMA